MQLEDWIQFEGTVYARSSKPGATGPPGEAEILQLNPERRTRILSESGWGDLCAGTLNLRIAERDVHMLATLEPLFVEPAPIYPEKYAGVPKKRIGYWYYRARVGKVRSNGKARRRRTHVIVRRAINPCKGVVEVLAPDKLREALNLKDGDKLSVKVVSKPARSAKVFSRDVVDQYKGATAFLCVNGPSFKDINRGPLKFVHTMCVNNGPKALMPKLRPNFWTCVDGADKFLHTIWRDPTIMKFAPTSAKHKPLWNSDTDLPAGVSVNECPNVVYYERNTSFNPDKYLSEASVNWGNSKHNKDENGRSGCRSVMLAAIKILYLAGFRKIYLLGCDFNMDTENHYSFEQDRKPSAIKNNQSTYRQLDWRFNRMKEHFDNHGLQVFNCNPKSGLAAFPFKSYEDALDDALSYTVDWREYVEGREESTAGLYETKWYCCPECNASARYTKQLIKDGDARCVCGFKYSEKNRRKYLRDQSQRNIES
jgi:hypothetical protein